MTIDDVLFGLYPVLATALSLAALSLSVIVALIVLRRDTAVSLLVTRKLTFLIVVACTALLAGAVATVLNNIDPAADVEVDRVARILATAARVYLIVSSINILHNLWHE